MSKKRKYTFTDLADDDFVEKNSNNFVINNTPIKNEDNTSEIKIKLDDLKKSENNLNNVINLENLDKKENEIEKKENTIVENNPESEKNNVNQVTKKTYEVNYDDILNEKPIEKKEIVQSFFEKKDPIKELFSSKQDTTNIVNT
ncbi:MAG: hypothetical protein K2G48_01175, partial [Malacoplasma sp.]|nr:hypothetical protein [Malacoplasma sp.]